MCKQVCRRSPSCTDDDDDSTAAAASMPSASWDKPPPPLCLAVYADEDAAALAMTHTNQQIVVTFGMRRKAGLQIGAAEKSATIF